jgi:hypothetical protein
MAKKKNYPFRTLILVGLTTGVVGFAVGGTIRTEEGSDLPERSDPSVPSGTVDIETLKRQVLPESGIAVKVRWGDLGKRLVDLGVIDRTKFDPLFSDQSQYLNYLEPTDEPTITVTAESARFWVDALWALGLAQKSPILTEGQMMQSGDASRFASTGGWNLAKGGAMDHYAKYELIPLTPEQQERTRSIAENVYRPCCGNSTAFPDCNHGMAALALVELMVSQGASDDEIYQSVLAFNTYWFPQTYLELAYQQQKNGTTWDRVDAKTILGKSFSSAMGYQAVRKQIGTVEGLNSQGGGGCGA